MSDQTNPFQRWLGIDDSNPDYFRILDINRDVADRSEIKAAALDAMRKIGEELPHENVKSWKLVRNEIKLAFKCLSDPRTREAYLAGLEKSTQRAPEQPVEDDSASARDNDSDSFVLNQNEDDSQETVQSLDTVVDEIQAEACSGKSNAPSVVETESESTATAHIPMAQVVDEPPVAYPAARSSNADLQGGFEEPVVVNTETKVQRRGKWLRRWIPAIFCGLVFAGAVTAGVFWVISDQDQVTNRILPDNQKVPESSTKTPANNNESDPLNDNQNGGEEPPTDEQGTDSKTDPIGEALSKDKPIVTIETNPVRPGQNMGKAKSKNNKSKDSTQKDRSENNNSKQTMASPTRLEPLEPNIQWSSVGTPSDTETALISHALEQAWFGIVRRDAAWTNDRLNSIRSMVMTRQQQRSWELLNHVSKQHELFWNRVVDSGRELRALDELKINDQIIAVIESKSNELVYKALGQRVARPYRQLPTLAAIAVATNGLSDDSQQAHHYLALLYAIGAKRNPFLIDKATEVFDEAKNANVNVAPYQEFVQNTWSDASAVKRDVRPSAEELEKAKLETGDDLPNRQSIRELDQPSATRESLRLLKMALTQTDNTQRFLLLQTAAEVAEKTHDPFIVVEILDAKQKYFGNANWTNDYISKLSRLSRSPLSLKNQNRLLKIYFELCERLMDDDKPKDAARILEVARRYAESNQLPNWTERIQRKSESRGESEDMRLTL